MGYLIVAVVAVAAAVFAMQNTTPVDVRFIFWQLAQTPVAAVVLASLGAGLIIAGVPLSFQLWRARRRVRALETAESDRLVSQREAAERAAAALRARSTGPPLPPGSTPPTGTDVRSR
jgi:uncharacterized integral membrane protein